LQCGIDSSAQIIRIGLGENAPEEIDAVGIYKNALLAPRNGIRDVQVDECL
jgi:hypothetical protein